MASSSLVLRQKGLRNLGQTCYLNVIVQILSYSKFIRQHVLSITLINADTDIKTTFQLFQDLIRDIQDPFDIRTALTPSGFVYNITSKITGFKLHQQQCSLEFFDGLLILLEKDLRQLERTY
jgi:ubiquitin C-terminal hydrolase